MIFSPQGSINVENFFSDINLSSSYYRGSSFQRREDHQDAQRRDDHQDGQQREDHEASQRGEDHQTAQQGEDHQAAQGVQSSRKQFLSLLRDCSILV